MPVNTDMSIQQNNMEITEELLNEKDTLIRNQACLIAELQVDVKNLKKEKHALLHRVTSLTFELKALKANIGDHVSSQATGPDTGQLETNKFRSSSVGGSPNSTSPQDTPSTGLKHQRSVSSNARLNRQRSYSKRNDDDVTIKRSRAWSTQYELSSDLHEKQLEMLERKYGGHLRAKRAARIIQQAYRKYTMSKNFEKMRSVKSEKRKHLTRGYSEMDASNNGWRDAAMKEMVVLQETSFNMATNHSRMESTMFARQQYMEINKLRKNLGQDENFMKAATPQHARQTLRQGTISSTSGQEHIYMRKPLQRGQGMDLSNGHPVGHGHAKPHPTGPPTKARPPPPMPKRTSSATKKPIRDLPIRQQPHEETNNNRNSYPELNDSSASASPADTPSESTIDLPSVNFENLLESKETDILSDSFHSDLSSLNSSSNVSQQQANNSHEQGMYPNSQGSSQSSLTSRHSQERTLTRDSDSSQRSSDNLNSPMEFDQSDRSYERFRSHCSAGSLDSDSFLTDVQIKVEGPTPTEENVEEDTFDIDNIEYPAPMELIKVYANTEVKLRNNRWRQQSGDSNKTLTNDSHYNGDPIIEEECISEVGTTQGRGPHASPIWKRKQGGGPGPSPQARSIDTSHNNLGNHGTCSQGSLGSLDDKRMSNISEASEPDSLEGAVSSSPSSDNISMGSEHSMGTGYQKLPPNMVQPPLRAPPKISDKQRKRQYRIGLNLFNKKPDKGIWYLIERRFLEHSPSAVARFLISRKGLSKYHIGDYLGNLQNDFNMDCLDCFVDEIDLSGLSIDVALRKFQTFFRMPGEAQKIERLMDAFAHRYCICNSDTVKNFHSADTVFLLAFAIIMLNTDLHNSSIKQERKMKVHEFIKNLRGIDEGCDVDRDMLVGIYERVKAHEFKSGTDHVTQVQKVEQTIVGKKPQLSLPHRRLVCYCRLYEVHDPNKKEKLGLHQREVFLFNDILVVTKIFNKKKSAITYTFRNSFNLCGMLVYPFDTPHYQHGIRLTTNIDGKVLMTFNARNEHDRTKFMEDLREAILEMNEMEAIRIEEELQRQKMVHNFTTTNLEFNRRSNDSGVVDIELLKPTENGSLNRLSAPEVNGGLKKSTLSNSLIDLADNGGGRRGSAGSLDSGMASTAGSVTGREDSPQPPGGATSKSNKQQPNPGQSGGIKLGFFSKKKSKSSARTQSDCSDA